MKSGEKSHALNDVALKNSRLRLRFLSFKKGHRPDVLDTNQFSIQPNPLSPAQTNVEWTHVLGGKVSNRYVLLIEMNRSGIWPSTLERYLQWLVDENYEPVNSEDSEDAEPVTIALNIEPGPEFLSRLEALDRVTESTVRIGRPNPGWHDLDSELGEMAAESDARKVDITASARRRRTLNKNTGVLSWIRNRFQENRLTYAAIKGWKGRRSEAFNTKKLGRTVYLDLPIDDRGQVDADDAWHVLSQAMDDLD